MDMKKTIIILSFLLLTIHLLHAQKFDGGNGDGHDIASLLNTNLGNLDFSVLYKGSHGDGHDVATLIHTNLGNFDFSVLFKGGSGDGNDVANLLSSTLSVEEIEELVKLDILLYPNSANHIVTIKANKETIITSVEIFNVAGQKINAHLSNSNSTINVSNLSDGMYLLKIVSKNGVVSKKLIVKKITLKYV